MTKRLRRRQFDEGWKKVLENFFWEFLEFYFPNVAEKSDKSKGYEFLDQELNKIATRSKSKKRRVDKLVKVYLKEEIEVWLLIHIEVQSYYDAEFPLRMFTYFYRIFDKFQKPVVSLAIMAGDTTTKKSPDNYEIKAMGETFIHFHFLTKDLWQWKEKEKELKKESNIFGIVTLAHIKSYEENDATRYEWKLTLTKMLYERGWKEDRIKALYYFLDSIFVLPENLEIQYNEDMKKYEEEQKMPYITTAERIGRQEGRQEGFRLGILRMLELVELINPEIAKKYKDDIEKSNNDKELETISKKILQEIKK